MKRQRKMLSTILKNSRFTDFQRRVYRAVSTIPDGEVRSYKWVAKRMNNPNAYRAVGNALNRNPYPKIIPCHRVVKSDGSIGGYSGGAALKRRLLESEGVDAALKRCYNLLIPKAGRENDRRA